MTSNYKIVKIISEYKVVVNAGSNSFIKEGDILEVYQPGQEVTDPETGDFDIQHFDTLLYHLVFEVCRQNNKRLPRTPACGRRGESQTSVVPLSLPHKDTATRRPGIGGQTGKAYWGKARSACSSRVRPVKPFPPPRTSRQLSEGFVSPVCPVHHANTIFFYFIR